MLFDESHMKESTSYRVFVSHGQEDSWVAGQMAARIRECGSTTFLDENDVATGDDFKRRIHAELAQCAELVVLFTPWSAHRNWVWVEVGAAWALDRRIVAVLYGTSIDELEKKGGSKAILEDVNLIGMNDFDGYLSELAARCAGDDECGGHCTELARADALWIRLPSYARADFSFARKLHTQLHTVGMVGFIDQVDLAQGASLQETMRTAIRRSKAVVVILSPSALNSHYVMAEVGIG